MPTNGDFIQRHAEAVAIDHQVTALHIISDKNSDASIEIREDLINGVRTYIGYIKFTRNPLLKYVRFISAFKRISKKIEAFDVVHLNRLYPLGIFAVYLKYIKRTPFIISEHWTGYTYPLSQKIGYFEKQSSKIITKHASFVCPVTDNLKKSMQGFGLKGNYLKIPNVVDTALFTPSNSRNENFTILHVSNMFDAHKNISGLLRAIATLKKEISDVKLILVGNGSDTYIDQLQELSIEDNVEIIPQVAHTTIAKFMQQADVFVLFSNYENLPCVILEAFSCGLPVISTDVGGISEFFPNDFGYLIPKNDSKILVETLLHFYQKNRKHDVSKMHQYVRDNFSPTEISKAFVNCYHTAIN